MTAHRFPVGVQVKDPGDDGQDRVHRIEGQPGALPYAVEARRALDDEGRDERASFGHTYVCASRWPATDRVSSGNASRALP